MASKGFFIIFLYGIYNCIDSAQILYAPYIEEIQLKTPLTFNITFVPENGTTLSVVQIFDSATTELLMINGTEVTLQNFWVGRVNINVDNRTENINVEVTIDMVTLEDEGKYAIRILDQQDEVLETIPYQLKTYALPASLSLSVDKNNHTEGNMTTFTCTGNVGRPMGILQLSSSTIRNSTEYFAPAYTLYNLTQITSTLLPNGTFSINHVFTFELTRNDDLRYFRCDVISAMPNHTVTHSNLKQMFVRFEGTQMNISPSSLVLESGIPPELTMLCQLTGTETSANVRSFLYIQIIRNSTRDQGQNEVIASMDPDNEASLGDIRDIIDRAPLVVGNLQKGDSSASPPTSRLVDMTMTWNSSLIQCEDEGEYHCVVGYLDNEYKSTEWTSSRSLTNLQTIPEDLRLEIRRNGFPIGSGEGTVTNPIRYAEGDTVDMSCSAKVGSDRNTRIEWHRTRPFTQTTEFIPYTPPVNEGVLDEGQVSENKDNCQYSRTTTLKYNITATDVNRENDLAFKCVIDKTIGGRPYTIESDRSVYIIAGSGNQGDNSQQVANAGGGSNAGAIAGGVIGGVVLIVLVVLLVYFLWYRRRGDGDYRTKEDQGAENPNMVTSGHDYAVPSKKTYQNHGLDEPHQDRRNHHNNDYDRHGYNDHGRRGRSNYGMDRDEDGYDSRDGSPTMTPHVNHMGDDGSIGTGV